jgi:hypothetical protein
LTLSSNLSLIPFFAATELLGGKGAFGRTPTKVQQQANRTRLSHRIDLYGDLDGGSVGFLRGAQYVMCVSAPRATSNMGVVCTRQTLTLTKSEHGYLHFDEFESDRVALSLAFQDCRN